MLILTHDTAERKLRRMALEIAERNAGAASLVLLGIRENGIYIARRMQEYLHAFYPGTVHVHALTLDKKNPGAVSIEGNIDWNDQTVLLIDDVANSGRTMLYALKPLLEALPKRIQTLALVERTHKQFPIAVDYVGLSVSTAPNQHIEVEVKEGQVTGAWLR